MVLKGYMETRSPGWGDWPVDWTPIISTLAGGAIVMASDAISRLSARRSANNEKKAKLRARETGAGEQIIAAFDQNPLPVIDSRGLELTESEVSRRLLNLTSAIYKNSLFINDIEMRRRLELCMNILDMATVPAPVLDLGMEPRAVGALVRRNVYLWLGAWFREEPFQDTNADWGRLLERHENWRSQWQEWTTAHGFDGSAHQTTTEIHGDRSVD
jgi:hypothetical protein